MSPTLVCSIAIFHDIDLIRERVIVGLRHSLPDGKLQKEGRALCFTAGLL